MLRHLLLISLSGLSAAANADTLTVGPLGSYQTLDAALDAAALTAVDDEIRIRAGTHITAAAAPFDQPGRVIAITGGWDSGFQNRDPNPASTILQGDGSNRILRIGGYTGVVRIDGLTFRGGVSAEGGAGIYIKRIVNPNPPPADIVVEIRNCVFIDNRATGFANGHAIDVDVTQGAQITIENNDFSGHLSSGEVIDLFANFAGTIKFNRNRLFGNLVGSTSLINATAGSAFGSSGTSTGTTGFVELIGNQVWNNHTLGAQPTAALIALGVDGDGVMQFRANSINGAQTAGVGSGAGFPVLVALRMRRYSTAHLTDNLIINGTAIGLRANAFDQARAYVHNNTVALNSGIGIDALLADFTATPPNAFGLANNISFANGTNFVMPSNPRAVMSSNLFSSDPLFINAANGDFRISSNSPARDAGTANPPGGLSASDLVGNPRVLGTTVDIGALEYVDEFANGFE